MLHDGHELFERDLSVTVGVVLHDILWRRREHDKFVEWSLVSIKITLYFVFCRAVHKKKSVSCQRVAVIVVSRAAAIFFSSNIFLGLVGKYCPFLKKKKKKIKNEKKKCPVAPFFRHPAGPPERECFFRLA